MQTSLSLLARVRENDGTAWARLTHLYSPLVYGWCRQCGLSAHDAGDVMQEVFLAVHRSLSGFRRDRAGDTFRGWLWSVTRNKIRDLHRAAAASAQASGGTTAHLMIQQVADDEPADSSSAAGTIQDGVILRGLELIQSEFEPNTWQAFWRFAVDGVKAVDVASELGMSPGAVRKAKLRVMRRLQEELDGLLN